MLKSVTAAACIRLFRMSSGADLREIEYPEMVRRT